MKHIYKTKLKPQPPQRITKLLNIILIHTSPHQRLKKNHFIAPSSRPLHKIHTIGNISTRRKSGPQKFIITCRNTLKIGIKNVGALYFSF